MLKIGLISACLTGLLVACAGKTEEGTKSYTGSPVRITKPRRQSLVKTIDLNANTIFLRKEIVRATFAGFIERINKDIGDRVRAGDLLLEVRTKELAADDSLTLSIDPDLLKGAVKIRARSNGVLTALNYHTGDFVAEGEEIAIISNPASLCISLNVPYEYVGQIHLHNRCDISLPDGREIAASIEKIIPSIDPVSQTQTFLLSPLDPVDLPENLNVIARLPIHTIDNAKVLPVTAILSNETQDSFWIMKLIDDTTAARVDIDKGTENDSLVQILAPGLHSDDRIISDGAYGLPDTARISIIR